MILKFDIAQVESLAHYTTSLIEQGLPVRDGHNGTGQWQPVERSAELPRITQQFYLNTRPRALLEVGGKVETK